MMADAVVERGSGGGRTGPTPEGAIASHQRANFLVNRQMNISQQMRWSRRGADLLLQVRSALYNRTFGSAYGQKFRPANDSFRSMAIAACPQS
jgi:hypothetical protein